MGKIRTRMVKRIARQILERYPGLFARDFEHNKKAVSSLIEVQSKKLRNQIAGYVTHLIAVENKRKERQSASE